MTTLSPVFVLGASGHGMYRKPSLTPLEVTRGLRTRLEVLKATRPEIELYVRAMEERGLAATTLDPAVRVPLLTH